MLFNIHDLCWDEELLTLFHIPKNMMPEVKPSSYIYGQTATEILAGLAVGYWKDKEEICANWQLDKKFDAAMEEETREKLLKGWKKAVKCALVWAEDTD